MGRGAPGAAGSRRGRNDGHRKSQHSGEANACELSPVLGLQAEVYAPWQNLAG